MPMTNPVAMASYITAMGEAARQAQVNMSRGANPMIIKEFRFKANIDVEINVEADSSLNFDIKLWSLSRKLSVGYKAEWGLEIECKIIPTVTADTE
ncbi:hypothetical protein HSACCH_02074 [Halanaerobium saccharolyticum subsp. saccharolyticum DSM 6643]|uniref:Uncharacterized protein n=1 Tax=Halanaerobium saccharolyticum subsp. saccharolyticum DSM 6643 TaxID=1293054 RepID=M5E2T1_9FIRM|nr:hypothetical protein [Halanaerobium saccharolyticum]CCU80484.1 hypothetical protein HSACCH_02074 [Halanaerobium saccharolyticum subsp. saccharolyticum DSM 6643]